MTRSEAPIHATVENIGKTVIVQVFNRDHPDANNIRPETQKTFVGELISYQSFDGGFAFKIKGLPRQTYLYIDHVVEIYLP